MSGRRLGAAVPGTVGTLSSGRLILVLETTRTSATLVSLPHQLYEGPFNDGARHLREGEQLTPFKASPFVTITAVSRGALDDDNRSFIDERSPDHTVSQRAFRTDVPPPTAEDLEEIDAAERAATTRAPQTTVSRRVTTHVRTNMRSPIAPRTGQTSQRGSQTGPLTVIGNPQPPFMVQYQKFDEQFALVLEHVRQHGAQGFDAVVAACLAHQRWANKRSAVKDVPWFLKNLVKLGHVAVAVEQHDDLPSAAQV